MAFGERWLTALAPFVRQQLPPPPARVLELGCGPLGGFVPALLASGYEARGVDRNAPPGARYEQLEFERYAPGRPADAIVASRSLHHVGDLGAVLDHVAATLRPAGVIVVAEWAWEQFDEATARWCFDRLGEPDAGDPGWLQRRRGAWLESGEAWEPYFGAWASGHGLHRSDRVVAELDRRFERTQCVRAPYFFAELAGIDEGEEQAAIDAGQIQATGIRYTGTLRETPSGG
jgi:SAM-dependent methyltransferase